MLTIDGMVVDAEISGEPTYESEMTTLPMENGANMNDHVRNLPIGFSCEGIISDTPLGSVRTLREATGADISGRAITDAGDAFMVDLWRRKQPVTVSCVLGTFDNMVLTSYAPQRKGGSIRFSAKFMTAFFVDNERTFVKVSTPRGQGTTKKKKASNPFEGPAMWRTVDYRKWVANGRTGPRVQEQVGRAPRGPNGDFIWVHADGVTPLDADEAEDWQLEQTDNFNDAHPTPGMRPGKVPGQLEKIPYDPYDQNATIAAQDRGAAYFSPTQNQWVTEKNTPVLGDYSQWGGQWDAYSKDEQAKGAAEQAAENPSYIPHDEGDTSWDTNGDGVFGEGDKEFDDI